MSTVTYQTDQQIRMLGFDALKRELGVAGFIRFMQQFETGSGDYTTDRDEWQDEYTVDTLAEAVQTYSCQQT